MTVLWLRRLVWLAAWLLWLCFGFALHRVVPRAAAPAVHLEGRRPKEQVVGFLDARPAIVSFDGERSELLVRSGEDGRLIGVHAARWRGSGGVPPVSTAFARALVRNESKPVGTGDVEVLDLLTGERRPLPAMGDHDCPLCGEQRLIDVHDVRPWAVGPNRETEGNGLLDVPRMSVFDLRTGEMVCTLPRADRPSTLEDCYCGPYFLPGSDRLVVHHLAADKVGGGSVWSIEVWRIPFGDAPERRIPSVKLNAMAVFSRTGRVAWKSDEAGPDAAACDVLDLNTGEFIFSTPARDQRPGGASLMEKTGGLEISADGRIINSDCWQVDLETGIRTADPWRGPFRCQFDRHRGLFEQRWYWETLLWGKDPNTLVGTQPFLTSRLGPLSIGRDAATGRIEYTCNQQAFSELPDNRWNLALVDNTVRQSPLRVRWGLIGAIQGIAALPLVFIAAFLIRRRISRRHAGYAGG